MAVKHSCWVGFDPREAAAFAVARETLRQNIPDDWPIYGLVLDKLIEAGVYTRPTKICVNGDGRFEMIDMLSVRPDYDGRISTQHANARFLVPYLAKTGWALFMDGDMLVKGNLGEMMLGLDPKYAAYCVKHDYRPSAGTKMDGQEQTRYARKNWSSMVVWNCSHPANKALTPEMVNTLPGRDLHAFCWLNDDQIGELDQSWNFLVGHTDPEIVPDVVHFTEGCPDMPGYEKVPYSDEWRRCLNDWAMGALSLPS